MTEELHQFATLLHRCAALWRTRLDERLRPWGMTQATWRTLWVLRSAAEPHNQSSLALRLGIETPTLVRILDRMEKLGLVRRAPDSRDRRQKYIEITDKGLALAGEIESEVLGTRQELLAGMDAAELLAGITMFEKILANAGESY
jgi:MarR family transcriptional regulator for hemolysin